MGINNPVPRSLSKESAKAAKILSSFIKPNQIFGQDQVIPPDVLSKAKGLAVITVLKAGFLFSGRAGSGVIVARLPDGGWSAPSAIVTAGAGVGGQIGAELTDFVFILNNKSAVDSFSQAGSITLGGNVSLAAGPLGRNAEAAGSATVGHVAAIFAYSKTKGLFAGVSLEGSVLIERREANRKFYGNNCTAKMILSGRVEPPPSCDSLFRVLESRAFRGIRPEDYDDDFYDDIPDDFSEADSYSSGGGGSGRAPGIARYTSSRRVNSGRGGGSRRDYDDDYLDAEDDDYNGDYEVDDTDYRRGSVRGDSRSNSRATPAASRGWEDDYYDRPAASSRSRRGGYDSPDRPTAPKPRINGSTTGSGRMRRFDEDEIYTPRSEMNHRREQQREKERRYEAGTLGQKAVALYTFKGEQSGDLAFRKGDIITVTKKSDNTDTWWTGKLGDKEGIFPANYVELM